MTGYPGRPRDGRAEVLVGVARGQLPAASRPRTGLVLGAGGVLGAAWMTGALPAVQEQLGRPVNDVDVIIGTSAGSVLAAALRCRAGADELVAHQQGAASALSGLGLPLPQDGPLPPLPHWQVGSPRLMATALLAPRRVPPWVGATAWVPRGRGQHVALRAMVDGLHRAAGRGAGPDGAPSPWVDGDTWVVAVDYDSGQRVVFGQDGAPPAALPDAVVASCSIPGWYEPVRIGGRRYVDGGVRSSTSLGLMAQAKVDEIYVLAPMASTVPGRPRSPQERLERRLRRLITCALLRDVQALRARGIRVTVLTPGPEDLMAMGANLMDPRRREAVLDTSLRTAAAALARQEDGQPQVA